MKSFENLLTDMEKRLPKAQQSRETSSGAYHKLDQQLVNQPHHKTRFLCESHLLRLLCTLLYLNLQWSK